MENVVLSLADWVFLLFVVIIFACIVMRKNAVLPALVGLFCTGLALAHGNFFGALQTTYTAILAAGTDLLSLILIVSAISTLTKILGDMGTDKMMVAPARKLMRRPTMSFFSMTVITLLVSWVLRAAPTVALIGSLLVPAAVLAGMSPIVAGLLLAIVGKGIALSSDFVAQGTEVVTAKATKLPLGTILSATYPIWGIVSGVALIGLYITFLKLQKEEKARRASGDESHLDMFKTAEAAETITATPFAKAMVIVVPLLFVLDIIVTIVWKLSGDASMALTGGSFYLLSVICSIGHYKKDAFGELMGKVRDGWIFAVKVFGVVIVIAGFFWLSGQSLKDIIGDPKAQGLAYDWGYFIAAHLPINKFVVALLVAVTSAFASFDGSGYAAIPIGANIGMALGSQIGANVAYYAALAQMSAIWVGATMVPWGFLALTASVTNTNPQELARRSIVPVSIALLAGAILTALLV